MKKNILITGATGYVGSVLVPYLLDKGHAVISYDLDIYGGSHDPRAIHIQGDIRDRDRIIWAGHDATHMVHLACISNDPSFDLNPALAKSINLEAFDNILDCYRWNRMQRLVFASSASSYGIKESDVTEEVHQDPITDYALYKVACEAMLKDAGINYTVVRPATVCGDSPRLRLDLVLNILTAHAIINKKIKITGELLKRPLIHIKDMARVYELLLDAPDHLVSGEAFNAGSVNMTIGDMAQLVQETLADTSIALETIPTNDIRSYHLNSSKLKRVLGFRPLFSIEDAILSLKDAFARGRIIDGLQNPSYHNVKRMQEMGLV